MAAARVEGGLSSIVAHPRRVKDRSCLCLFTYCADKHLQTSIAENCDKRHAREAGDGGAKPFEGEQVSADHDQEPSKLGPSG